MQTAFSGMGSGGVPTIRSSFFDVVAFPRCSWNICHHIISDDAAGINRHEVVPPAAMPRFLGGAVRVRAMFLLPMTLFEFLMSGEMVTPAPAITSAHS